MCVRTLHTSALTFVNINTDIYLDTNTTACRFMMILSQKRTSEISEKQKGIILPDPITITVSLHILFHAKKRKKEKKNIAKLLLLCATVNQILKCIQKQ